MIINLSQVPWALATKTKSVKAKALINLLVDKSVTNKFLVDTLEGKEPLADGAVICLGEHNDIWQQMPNKLLRTYQVVDVDKEGWMICQPLPSNAVDCTAINENLVNPNEQNYIIGQYGETLPDGTTNAQKVEAGDWVCRDRTNHVDVWVVRKKIFYNTYTIKS